jgi:phenylalanine-4-hydroxylase
MSTQTHAETASSIESPVAQNWDRYSEVDHEVWQILYAKRMRELESTASDVFLRGADLIGLSENYIPDLLEVNRRLEPRTGWNAVPVGGFLPAKEFFASLSRRRFPTTVTIRSRDSIDYVPEPDIFHDVFGHVPLHSDPAFAGFLQRFGEAASLASSPAEVEMMARFFWFTVEFGLVRERGATRIYGSGLISSAGDAANALGHSCDRRPFSIGSVIDQPFRIDALQDVLFVVESFDELFEAVERVIEAMRDGDPSRLHRR